MSGGASASITAGLRDDVVWRVAGHNLQRVGHLSGAGRRSGGTHYDFLAKLEETTSLPPGPTGLQPLPDMLVRLSRAPVVSNASIHRRATGVGSELALACDMRLASRQKAILSHFEVEPDVWPGGAPMARLPRFEGRGRA